MNLQLRVPLDTSPEQRARLRALRAVFAQACNALAPHVQHSRVWNRVALHHLHYRALREQFPELGSQMVCNAIYAVSKMARLIYQHPASPYNLTRRAGQALPLLKFADNCPVYFDRHTLSIKPGQLSLFTMDGRMRFELALDAEKLALFDKARLREVVLNERPDRVFELSFFLEAADATASGPGAADALAQATSGEEVPDNSVPADASAAAIPDYVSVEDAS